MTDKSSHRAIRVLVHDKGETLTEVVRAFLHGGAPSALLTRIIAGVQEFNAQCGVVEDLNFNEGFISELTALRQKWRDKETEYYK